MVAAITTYMVIFIQFMPKEDHTGTIPTAVVNGTDSAEEGILMGNNSIKQE